MLLLVRQGKARPAAASPTARHGIARQATAQQGTALHGIARHSKPRQAPQQTLQPGVMHTSPRVQKEKMSDLNYSCLSGEPSFSFETIIIMV
jgi:hypothetical protein